MKVKDLKLFPKKLDHVKWCRIYIDSFCNCGAMGHNQALDIVGELELPKIDEGII